MKIGMGVLIAAVLTGTTTENETDEMIDDHHHEDDDAMEMESSMIYRAKTYKSVSPYHFRQLGRLQ